MNELRETRERPHNCACSLWEYNYTITAVNANNAPFCACTSVLMTTMCNFNVCINCVKVFNALATIPLHNVRTSNGRYLYTMKAEFPAMITSAKLRCDRYLQPWRTQENPKENPKKTDSQSQRTESEPRANRESPQKPTKFKLHFRTFEPVVYLNMHPLSMKLLHFIGHCSKLSVVLVCVQLQRPINARSGREAVENVRECESLKRRSSSKR